MEFWDNNMFVTVFSAYLVTVVSNISACCLDSCNFFARDCQDVSTFGFTESWVYHVIPDGTYTGYDVYCDLKTDNGGWLVFQRRMDGSENFFRGWDEYEFGFGDISGEYWLGNLPLYIITSGGLYELRVDLEDWDGNTTFASYKIFRVRSTEENYRLEVSGYSGTAGDSLSYHNGFPFSTKDRDFSTSPSGKSCASQNNGAWWYNSCFESNLNALYLKGYHNETFKYSSVQWKNFRGFQYSLKRTEMKIRRR